MTEATNVSRTVDTDLAPEDLWALVADGESWSAWMVDEADVRVAPGAGGRVVDDGVERTVRIDHVDVDRDSRRVGFTWWPDDRPDLVSAVELVVLPAANGSRLHVHETHASTSASVAATWSWDVRVMLLLVSRASLRASERSGSVQALAVHV